MALRRLAPDYLWQRIALPRMLYLLGQHDRAMALYDGEMRRAPDNAFLLREVYFMGLSEGDAAGLERLAATCEGLWRGRAMPAPVERLMARALAGAAAVRGAPAALLSLVTADAAAYDAAAFGPRATMQGRASIDLMFVYAMEFAWAHRPDEAIALLDRALAARSLYWPASLPYGPAEFPPIVRDDPRYAALWTSDPRLVALISRRREAILGGQMSGVRPDGTRVQTVRV
jgi:tetratricopeptide (TPR) repeat protein